jgi:DNA-binding XRE family transcriptional regulator
MAATYRIWVPLGYDRFGSNPLLPTVTVGVTVNTEMDLPPLKAFRKKHDPPLSQRALADLLGVDRVTVARWETGIRKIDADRLSDVSARTGIPRTKLRPDLAALMRDAAE